MQERIKDILGGLHMRQKNMHISKRKSVKKTKLKRTKKKACKIFFKILLFYMFIIVLIVLWSGAGMVKRIIENAPDITSENVIPRGYKSVILDAQGNKTADLIAEGSNRTWVDLDEIPRHVQQAFIAIEDERFYEHNGVDVKGITRALYKGIRNDFHFTEGASTITQQLLKNNLFDFMSEAGIEERIARKLQEQYLAIKLEQEIMTKDEILEAYLNTINLGQNTLGIQAASDRYFGKDAAELTISEAAVIAGITKNPAYYNPISYPENNRKRQEIVLSDLLEQGYISQSEYEQALNDDVYARIKSVNESMDRETVYSYYVDAVIKEVLNDLQEYKGYTYEQAYHILYYGGLTIESAQDPHIQSIMDEEMQNEENYPLDIKTGLEYELTVVKPDGRQLNYSKEDLIAYYKEKGLENFELLFDSQEEAKDYIDEYKSTVVENGDKFYETADFTIQPQASMVIMEQDTGIVKGIVGGLGTKKMCLALNRATDIVRQPGSTFKVISTYAPALDRAGMSLATTQFDAPYAYTNGRNVCNWNGEAYQGWSTLRRGIEQSMNVVAVRTITDITPDLAYNYAVNFGFTSLVGEMDRNGNSDIVQPMALGGLTNGVSNLELTAAYAAIANQGVYTKPVLYTKILDHNGNVLIENQPQTRTVVKETTAWLLTSAMQDVVKQGTGKAAYFSGMAVAGKTGTTSKYNDVWFVGYTPYYTAGIWAGYDNNHKLGSKEERQFHEKIWSKVMFRIHEELPEKDFEKPDGIVSATVCSQSGRLPIPGICDGCLKTEYFEAGTVPTDLCDVHVVETVCLESNQLATDQCVNVEMRIITLTPENTQEANSSIYERKLAFPVCTLHPEILFVDMENQYGDNSEQHY